MIDDKWKKIITACLVVLLVIGAGLWFFCAGRNDVSDIRERADDTRRELESAGEEQRDQAAALDRAENAADRSQSAIRDSEERTDRVEELERSDAEIIRQSQSILERVRARGKTENQS